MRYALLLLLTCTFYVTKAQEIKQREQLIDKWTKATINVLCYSKYQRDILLQLDSALSIHKIDSNQYNFYIRQLVASGSSGTAVWFTYKDHNFLLSARHVFEDISMGAGSCFNEIQIIENDTLHSINRNQFESGPHRTFAAEVGTPSDKIFVNNTKLYKFSSVDNDMAIVNIDSSYYAYGIYKFLKSGGYKPVDISDIDTLFRVKNGAPVFAIGYPNESVIKTKSDIELPTKFALATSPVFTIPIITTGIVRDIGNNSDSFEICIFTYHGFSGGPIINKKGKLIGITHGFVAPKRNASKSNYYEYHGEFKKASLVMPLLRELLVQVQSQQMQLRHF